ncbi:MAG: hypothetical protein IIW10_00200, partial [Spirochaetaceae bacterium]|nr:hypothetical protein [Spirochaetaceae bacterium]
MGLNIKDLFKKKETIQEEPPLPAYPDSEEEKPALDFSKMKRSDEELGIAMDGWSDFLSESPISEDILLEIQQPTPEDFEQGTEEEADTPEITLSEKFISDLETIHEKPEEFVPSTNFSEFRPLTALNCDEEEIDPLAAFLRWSEKNPQKNVRPGKKNFQPVENREEKAVIPGDDSPDVIDGKLNALLFIDDYANMGSVVGKSTDNNSPVNDKSANTDEFSENVSDSEPLLSEEIFSTSPVAESETQPETFPTIIADNSEAENRGASSDDPHDVADEREPEIDLPVSSSKPETYSVDEDVPMSLDDVFKALSSGGPLSDGEFSADDSMVITSEMMASVYNETETASPQTNLSATETETVPSQTNFSVPETEAALPQTNLSATETEAASHQINFSVPETETALPQTNLSATETEAVPSQTNFSVPETETASPQTN